MKKKNLLYKGELHSLGQEYSKVPSIKWKDNVYKTEIHVKCIVCFFLLLGVPQSNNEKWLVTSLMTLWKVQQAILEKDRWQLSVILRLFSTDDWGATNAKHWCLWTRVVTQ